MTVSDIAVSAVNGSRRVIRRAGESARIFPAFIRKPRLILRWLFGAHRAQIALVVSVVVLTLVLPPVLDAILKKVYPDTLTGMISGLFGGADQSTKRAAAHTVIDAIAWSASGALVLILLWLHVPLTVRRAKEAAGARESMADSLTASDPHKSMELYRSAIALVCEAVREAALQSKIDALGHAMPTVTRVPAAPHAVERRHRKATRAQGIVVAGRYAIAGELGRGASGVVYRANDRVLQRPVALKELAGDLTGDKSTAPRFRQEARVLAQLSHPFIVQVYDLLEENGRLWMAMELIEGGDLSARLRGEDRLPLPQAVLLGRRMAEAVAFAHGRGVIHRDLKPLNVMLVDEQTPKIADFGLAKLKGSTLHTIEGTVMGSPHYMSPEQADARPVDHRTDIYSLGAVLYHMIAGQPPFVGDLSAVLAQHIRKPARSLIDACPDIDVPSDLDRLILQMLAKRPAERPMNMEAIASQLAQLSPHGAAADVAKR